MKRVFSKGIIHHFSCFVILISQNIYVLLFKMFVIEILHKKKHFKLFPLIKLVYP